jgi:hypothetical protein
VGYEIKKPIIEHYISLKVKINESVYDFDVNTQKYQRNIDEIGYSKLSLIQQNFYNRFDLFWSYLIFKNIKL